MGQYNYNGKRKNGFGIERYKNGSVYVGDFNENEISGRGVLIAKDKGIANVQDAVVYVGAYRNGKKSGKGRCYDSSGNLLYEGKFENDKPISPTGNPGSSDIAFAMIETPEFLYWGEMCNGQANGYGLKITDEGETIYGRFENDTPVSIGMVFLSPDVWEVGR